MVNHGSHVHFMFSSSSSIYNTKRAHLTTTETLGLKWQDLYLHGLRNLFLELSDIHRIICRQSDSQTSVHIFIMNPPCIPFLLSTGPSVLVGGGWNAFSLSVLLLLSASASRTCINSHSEKVSFIWFCAPRKNLCWVQGQLTCSPDMHICYLLYVWLLNISWSYHLSMYLSLLSLPCFSLLLLQKILTRRQLLVHLMEMHVCECMSGYVPLTQPLPFTHTHTPCFLVGGEGRECSPFSPLSSWASVAGHCFF